MIRSNPPSASVWTCSNTPASIYPPRRARNVVSDPWWSRIASIGPVTAQRMSLGRGREQRLHCLPDDIDHFLVERA
jgi:hypothetical protein